MLTDKGQMCAFKGVCFFPPWFFAILYKFSRIIKWNEEVVDRWFLFPPLLPCIATQPFHAQAHTTPTSKISLLSTHKYWNFYSTHRTVEVQKLGSTVIILFDVFVAPLNYLLSINLLSFNLLSIIFKPWSSRLMCL